MSDNALIVTKNKDLAVYLHDYGGPEHVEPILTYCGLHAYRPPERDVYGWARLCQVLGNYIGGNLSLGIYPHDIAPPPFDNGAYIIEDWRVVKRTSKYAEPLPDYFDMRRRLHVIDACMPEREQLGDYIDSVIIPVEKVELGMVAWLWHWDRPKRHTVVGFGPQEAEEELRGKPVLNVVKMPGEEYWMRKDNYLLEDFVWIEKPILWDERPLCCSWEKRRKGR